MAIGSDPEYVKAVLPLEQERVSTLADFGPTCEFFFVDEVEFDPKAVEKAFGHGHVRGLFERLIARSPELLDAELWEHCVKAWADENGMEKMGPVVMPIRVAMTGKLAGPGLFDMLAVLGPDRVKARLERALGMLP